MIRNNASFTRRLLGTATLFACAFSNLPPVAYAQATNPIVSKQSVLVPFLGKQLPQQLSGRSNAPTASRTFYGPPYYTYNVYPINGANSISDLLNIAFDEFLNDPDVKQYPEGGCQQDVHYYLNNNDGIFARWTIIGSGSPYCSMNNLQYPDSDWNVIQGYAYSYDPRRNFGSGDCDGGEGSNSGNRGSGISGGTNSPGQQANSSSCAEEKGAPMVGDPINASTGNYYLQENDYTGSWWLTFRRFYNSSTNVAPGSMGANWRDSFDRSIDIMIDGLDGNGSAFITLYRPDGKQETFTKTGGVWEGDSDHPDVLLENDDSLGNATSYTIFVTALHQFETYNTQGLLTNVTDETGQGITLVYSTASTNPAIAPAPNLLLTVTDPQGHQLNFMYNSASQLQQVTLPDGGVLTYGYDSNANLTSVAYPDGHTGQYVYNESAFTGGQTFRHAITGIIDASGGRYESVSYDINGRAISSAFAGNVGGTQIAFNSDGSSTVLYPLGTGARMSFATTVNGLIRVAGIDQPCAPNCNQPMAARTYDANGNPQSSTDFNGNVTGYTYDPNGLETARVEAKGTSVQRTINTQWDTVLRNPLDRTVLNAGGTLTAKTDWVYNVRGQVTARCEDDPTVPGATSYVCAIGGTPPNGVRRWVYAYCNSIGSGCPLVGLLLSIKGPRGDVTRYAYYPSTVLSACATPGGACHYLGDLWKVTDALGHVTTTVSYDKNGRPTEIKDPNGVGTTFTYTPRGWLQTRTIAGATTTVNYDPVGNVIKVTQPDGVYTRYGYDSAHRLTDIYDVLGNDVHFTLDAAGDRTAENTYSSGSTTPTRSLSRVYNTLGQLQKSLDAYANTTVYGYDPNGNRTDATDPYGFDTHQNWDALNRLSKTVQNYLGTDPATGNTTTGYGYDNNDNLNLVTDPTALNTSYSYSGLNDLDQLQSPDTGTTIFAYDAAGNRLTKTDANGVLATYTYDPLNRLTSIKYPVASLDVSYFYDQANSTTGCARSYRIDRLTEMVDSTGSTFYCYDAHGNVTLKRQVISGSTYTTGYTWNAADRLVGIGYPDGATVTYTRDADGRISGVSAAPVGEASTALVSQIGYLPFGPATAYDFAGGGQVLDKFYDLNYRATDIEGSALNLHFTLDAMGDIKAEGNTTGVPMPNESYVYDPLYRLLQVDNAAGAPWQTYTYNQTGDRLTKVVAGLGTDTYSYTPNTHHLSGIRGYDNSSRAVDATGNTTAFQANGITYGLGYDDTDRLTVVQQNKVTAATYTINGVGERTVKVVAGGANTVYTYDEVGHLLGEYTGTTHRNYVWADGVLVATLDTPTEDGETVHYVYTDQLGTPRAATDAAGALAWSWAYNQDPFGDALASNGAYTLNLRYPGQYYDQEDGLNYDYFRDYEPGTGRYVQSDPIGLGGGVTTYAYVRGNPISFVDPLGLYCLREWQIDGIAGAAVGGVLGAVAGSETGPGAIITGLAGAAINGGLGAIGGLLETSQANGAVLGAAGALAAGGSRAELAGAGYGGALGGAVSSQLENSGYPPGVALPTGGAVGGSVGAVVSGYFKGLSVSGMLTSGLKGGAIGLAAGAAQSGLEAALRAGNSCDCKQ